MATGKEKEKGARRGGMVDVVVVVVSIGVCGRGRWFLSLFGVVSAESAVDGFAELKGGDCWFRSPFNICGVSLIRNGSVN